MKKKSTLLFFLIFLLGLLISQEIEISEKIIKPNIYGEVSISKIEPLSSPYFVEATVSISNPNDVNLTLYIYEKLDSKWKKVGEIGEIGANENKTYNLSFRFEYRGVNESENEYLVVGIEKLYGFKFKIYEDWGRYERQMKSYISYLGMVITPILFLILSLGLFILAKTASKRKAHGKYPMEYTFETLFRIPLDTPLSTKVLLILSNPIFWVSIAILVIFFFSSLAFKKYQRADFEIFSIIIFSVLSAAILPIFFSILTWYADLYEREPLRFIFAMFFWGIAAAWIAFIINTFLLSVFDIKSEIFLIVFVGILLSPIVEEIVKSVGVVLFSMHHQFDDTLDGLLYGFCIGCGFAFVENLFYFTMKYSVFEVGFEPWIFLILYRSFFNTLAHGFLTGFLGAFLGFFKNRIENYLLSYFPALFLVIILHMIFNFTAIYDAIAIETYRFTTFIFSPILVFVLGIGFILIYILGIKETKDRVFVLSQV